MKEIRIAKVNQREFPVLISDEKEALLAAKAAGRAIVGLWRPGMDMEELAPARYVIGDISDASGEFLERTVRRHLGLPWKICETERLLIREMSGDDFDEVWANQVGRGFGTVEEFLAYTKNQYSFYEFGFWALVEKASGELIGVAGLTVPEEMDGAAEGGGHGPDQKKTGVYVRDVSKACGSRPSAVSGSGSLPVSVLSPSEGLTLELGYHIFPGFRRKGFAREGCLAIMKYGEEELGVTRFLARIRKGNHASENLALSLGFQMESPLF